MVERDTRASETCKLIQRYLNGKYWPRKLNEFRSICIYLAASSVYAEKGVWISGIKGKSPGNLHLSSEKLATTGVKFYDTVQLLRNRGGVR